MVIDTYSIDFGEETKWFHKATLTCWRIVYDPVAKQTVPNYTRPFFSGGETHTPDSNEIFEADTEQECLDHLDALSIPYPPKTGE